jgi:AcrR family transcriptional regulator
MARPAYSEERVDEIQAEILEVALEFFRREGSTALTLRAIAKRMGWTPAALYRYFGSKDDLLAAIRAHGFVRIRAAIESARLGAVDPADAAKRAIRAYLEFALDESALFRLMYELDQGDAPSLPHVRAEREGAFAQARAIAADAVEAGLMQGDANLAAHVLWVGCHGLASLALAHQLDLGCSYEDLVEPLIVRMTAPLAQ